MSSAASSSRRSIRQGSPSCVSAPSALIYLRVDDVRTTAEKLRAAGVPVDTEPHLIYADTDGIFGEAGWEEWMAFVRDSEGNLVGLASRHAPA
jgi:methylmalonyl-CoA/ethylmalonyl-CoA epimerase